MAKCGSEGGQIHIARKDLGRELLLRWKKTLILQHSEFQDQLSLFITQVQDCIELCDAIRLNCKMRGTDNLVIFHSQLILREAILAVWHKRLEEDHDIRQHLERGNDISNDILAECTESLAEDIKKRLIHLSQPSGGRLNRIGGPYSQRPEFLKINARFTALSKTVVERVEILASQIKPS
jgi:hypothetical protein